MKKYGCIIFILICSISLSGCFALGEQIFYYDSLPDYIERMSINSPGYSSLSIDHPDYFLPSRTFFKDFEYIEGEFYFYEESPFNLKTYFPARSLLVLKYDESIYPEAKEYMLENIPMAGDCFYTYGNYVFYRNKNFIDDSSPSGFPDYFVMACYNDEKQMLCFLGFYIENLKMDDKYAEDIYGNWPSFIDEYYGEYYDFSE